MKRLDLDEENNSADHAFAGNGRRRRNRSNLENFYHCGKHSPHPSYKKRKDPNQHIHLQNNRQDSVEDGLQTAFLDTVAPPDCFQDNNHS